MSAKQVNFKVPVQQSGNARSLSKVAPAGMVVPHQQTRGYRLTKAWAVAMKGGDDDDEGEVKCQFKVFMLCMGLVLIASGIGLTVHGVDTTLRDLIILGSGFIIIGTVLLIVSIFLTCWDMCKRLRQNSHFVYPEEKITEEYIIRNVDVNTNHVARDIRPSVVELYGTTLNRPGSKTSGTAQSVATTSDLHFRDSPTSPPSLTLPQVVGRETTKTENETIFTIPINPHNIQPVES